MTTTGGIASALEASFRIPFARDTDGIEVRPEHATAGSFTCPDCGTLVSHRRAHLREGNPVRAHFAHHPNIACGFSQGEGELHLRAKHAVMEAVASRRPVTLARRCPACGRETAQRLPEHVVRASLEHRLASGRRADVALFDDSDGLLAVIEILETHAVDELKRADLVGLRWCEIQARDILASDRWALVQDELLPFTCRPCRYTELRAWQGTTRLEVSCPLPGASAVIAVETCARCPYFIEATGEGIRCWGVGAR